MKAGKSEKKALFPKIAVCVLVLYLVGMFVVLFYKDIFYKDYRTIHSEVDADMPGYEIPIAKNVELLNNRVSQGIAYEKYNMAPGEYKERMEELEADRQKDKEIKNIYSVYFSYAMRELGVGFESSYIILSAKKAEIKEIDKDNGVTDMYDVKFRIVLVEGGEEKLSRKFERKIAEVDDSWIFYDEAFSIVDYVLASFYLDEIYDDNE